MGYPELPPHYSLKTEISMGTGGSGRGTVAVTGRISARVCTTVLRLTGNWLTEKSNRLYGAQGILLSGDNSRKKRGCIACGAETMVYTETEASHQFLSFPLCPVAQCTVQRYSARFFAGNKSIHTSVHLLYIDGKTHVL